jgi:DNA-binding MarR family transcriptional regulator
MFHMGRTQNETLEYLIRHPGLHKATDIAEHLGITRQHATNTLQRLAAKNIIDRYRQQGSQTIWYALPPKGPRIAKPHPNTRATYTDAA